MAAWFDLIPRVEALEERGLTVATDYHGQGLPKWLQPALGDCDVFMLNAKGVATDNTLCIVRLSEFEKLLTAAAKGES
jgi:pyruvate-formate lyase-activating enzyme